MGTTWKVTLAAAALVAVATVRPGPTAVAARTGAALPLDSLLRAHSHVLDETGSGLGGPGMTLLMEAARGTQFFIVAENHYRAEIPRITGHLFEALHRDRGYGYLAVENGPYIARRFADPAVRGRPDAAYGLAVRYPGALQFLSDEEIDLLVRVGAISGSFEPIWGVDRPFGGAHILEALVAAAPDSAARALAETIHRRAAALEVQRTPAGMKRWIVRETDRAQLDSLRRALRLEPGSPADSMMAALELSHATYAAYVDATRGAATGYASNRDREEFMKRRLAFELGAARDRTGALPRVLIKVGHWHAIRGRNPGNVFSLGGMAAELALADGARSFSLATGLVGDPEGATPLGGSDPGYAALAAVGDPDGWRVIDFRPLRGLVHAGQVDGVTPALERWIFGFDAVLLIGGSRAATFDGLMAAAGRAGG